MTSSAAIRRGWERRRAALDARFWDRMDRSGGPASCWEWQGGRQTPKPDYPYIGYGVYHRQGKAVYAHRRALELSLGRALGPGMLACHTCDNPPCCNPAHLFEGTSADNSRDMKAKGRSPRGRQPNPSVRGIAA